MAIPHSKQIETNHHVFLDDLETSLQGFLSHAKKNDALRSIFKTSTAAYATYRAFATKPAPTQLLMNAAAGSIRRTCALSMMRQHSLTQVELRRTIECALWDTYFLDHPVEWQHFCANPHQRADGRDETPIASAAGAPIGFYFRYASERMSTEPSGLLTNVLGSLKTSYGELSATVHAATGAISTSMVMAFDPWTNAKGQALRLLCKRVLKAVVILSAATDPTRLGFLDAIDRGWFDWLIGAAASRAIRGARFGLSR